jgi:hypothetical protein
MKLKIEVFYIWIHFNFCTQELLADSKIVINEFMKTGRKKPRF